MHTVSIYRSLVSLVQSTFYIMVLPFGADLARNCPNKNIVLFLTRFLHSSCQSLLFPILLHKAFALKNNADHLKRCPSFLAFFAISLAFGRT